ncbi:MAG: Asp-tRNA(Asn)/Glu-tRNA(Gln) amidotransferase subunit GatB [Acidimicrobiaceae bacterium]|nr:Asp-tRNA(Asn)/Glu-tRNA(Gln) amidotransferase subunit GatB [Acidimicrobiaceae bacterium]
MSGTVREPALAPDWELVVGLEVHVELSTASKLFCGCANRFGDAPNTNVCPVCLGLPGSLPVVNARAVDLAMRLGRALGCTVGGAVFARKNYFYPDMPKDYQISQYDQPTSIDGSLELPDGRRIGIERAHIEEDTGKTVHIGGGGRIHDADYALIDYNRAGVPLVEIVSRPEIRSAEQARSYVRELRGVLLATGVSDARMEEGSMRVDANVSVRPAGSDELRTRCEIKNLSSLRSLGRAVEHEARRHAALWSDGDQPRQETRHWDEANGRTTPGRSKEDADDYRYFQDPDLVPLAPDAATVAALDAALPRLPADRRSELAAACAAAGAAASPEAAALLVERGQDDLVAAALKAGADPAVTVTRMVNDLAVEDWSKVTAGGLAALVALETSGQVTATQAKQLMAAMAESGDAPEKIAERLGFEAMSGADLAVTVDEIIAGNADTWQRYLSGDEAERKKLAGFFTGQVMRATKGRADGAAVNRLLHERSARGAS